jgi:hypothetical protein
MTERRRGPTAAERGHTELGTTVPWLQKCNRTAVMLALRTLERYWRQVSLIFGNQTEDDIILKQEIDDMARMHKNFKVWAPCCELRVGRMASCVQ